MKMKKLQNILNQKYKLGNNNIHIFYIHQTEKLAEAVFEKFLFQLPQFFQQEINAYKHWESAQASLLGKILLSHAFKQLNINYSLHDIQIGIKDRPYINDEIDFNISHSGKYIAVAIVENARVGIDIETHRELNVQLFRKYFDDNEWNEIQTSGNSIKAFFEFWTIKESAIKCDGRGVEILSKTHVVSSKQNQLLSADMIKCDVTMFYYQQIAIETNYSCCICSNDDFKINLTQLHLSVLVNA